MKKTRHFHLNRRELTRREFLKSLLGAAAGLGLLHLRPSLALTRTTLVKGLPAVGRAYVPLPCSTVGSCTSTPERYNFDFDSAKYYGRTQAPGVVV